jgi:hypothetical protein
MNKVFAPILALAIVGCAGNVDEPGQTLKLVSADSENGLVVEYRGEVAFTFEASADSNLNQSRIVLADGSVLTSLALPSDVRLDDAAMVDHINSAAAKVSRDDAYAYRMAMEDMVAYLANLSAKNQHYIDTHIDLAVHQVLLLVAIDEEGMSGSPVCAEFLTNPTDIPYHTMADHEIDPELLDNVETDKLFHILCLAHDYACYTCGHWLCGWSCEPYNLDCAGRCGGGCG